jgi:hypothetical protein
MKKEKIGTSTFFSLLILVVTEIVFTIGTTALAVTMPVVETLPSIDAQVDMPTAVTVDAHGRVYVAESENYRVRVFTQSGQFVATLTIPAKPISVAVDAAGRIYVGSALLDNVTVFAADFTQLFKLGSGDGEFIEPADIDIDGSGQIYVVDKVNNTVRVYNAAGVLLKSIGSPGNDNGQLYHPTSLAIDPASSELVIIDHPLILDDVTQGYVDGARIQFFGIDGTFHRGYPKFGYNMNAGDLRRPAQVAVDPESRVYITDSWSQKVMVYDKNGVFLGMIDNTTDPLRTPLGLSMAASGRLYVASLLGGKVNVFGIDAYSAMGLTPATLNFTATEGGNAPDQQDVAIINSGKQDLTWTAATTTVWLNLAPMAGTLQPAATGTLAVGVNNAGLAQGIYQGNISVMVLGVAETVAVTLTVNPNPLLVSPTSLSLTTTKSTTPASLPAFLALLSVDNAGTEPLNWSVTADPSWLKLSKASGRGPDQVEVSADVSALELGTHTATITFINGSTGGSVVVPVSLHINEHNPLLVSPAILSFTTTTNTNPATQSLSVTSAGTDPLTWSATADQSWLKLSKAAGATPEQVDISADVSALNAGTHTATITFINSSTGESVAVPVSLSISEPNPLLVSPVSLSLTNKTVVSPSTLTVANSAISPPLNWSVAVDQSWLQLSKAAGHTPDDVKIVADISALKPGPYVATITFSNKSTGGDVLVPVSLIVSEPNPLLVSPASLSFTTKKGTRPSTQALSVANNGGTDKLNWSAAADQDWLKLSKATGETPALVDIDADVSALDPGIHSAIITFINDSTGSSVPVQVSLNISRSGMFPWMIIIQDIANIGEQQQKQDKEDKDQTSKGQKPAKISVPGTR